MDRPSTERSVLLPALILALGLVLAALVFGVLFYQARDTGDTVQTVGAATEQFTADVAKWRLSLTRQTGLDDQQAGYAGLAADIRALRTQLAGLGLPDTSVTVQPPNSHPTYGYNGTPTGYQVQQSLFVVSSNVDGIEALALDPASLATGGASLQMSTLEYFYSDLDALKRSLLARATEDARARAREIVGRDVEHMTEARAGVFQITEPYSTEVASYGMHSTSTRKQEITVTVHATFDVD
jgi:hypothetical protein